jgi:hypothetical protein
VDATAANDEGSEGSPARVAEQLAIALMSQARDMNTKVLGMLGQIAVADRLVGWSLQVKALAAALVQAEERRRAVLAIAASDAMDGRAEDLIREALNDD